MNYINRKIIRTITRVSELVTTEITDAKTNCLPGLIKILGGQRGGTTTLFLPDSNQYVLATAILNVIVVTRSCMVMSVGESGLGAERENV